VLTFRRFAASKRALSDLVNGGAAPAQDAADRPENPVFDAVTAFFPCFATLLSLQRLRRRRRCADGGHALRGDRNRNNSTSSRTAWFAIAGDTQRFAAA
jgi:hypothetical protein